MGDIELTFDVIGADNLARDIHDSITDGIRSAAPEIAQTAKSTAQIRIIQAGAVWRGVLVDSFDWDVSRAGKTWSIEVTNDAEQAAALEYGAEYGAKGPPLLPLIPWVRTNMFGWNTDNKDAWPASGIDRTTREPAESEPSAFSGTFSFDTISGDRRTRIEDEIDRIGDRADLSPLEDVRDNNGAPDREPLGFMEAFVTQTDGELDYSKGYFDPDKVKDSTVEVFFDEGHFAGGTVEHVVRHELAHSIHYKALDDQLGALPELGDWPNWITNEQIERIREEISTYAATQPSEFVAEVGALLLADKDVPDDLLRLYYGFYGPDMSA